MIFLDHKTSPKLSDCDDQSISSSANASELVDGWYGSYCVHRRRVFKISGETAKDRIGLVYRFQIGMFLLLSDPFQGVGAWRKTMEPQKPANSPGPGSEVVERNGVAKE